MLQLELRYTSFNLHEWWNVIIIILKDTELLEDNMSIYTMDIYLFKLMNYIYFYYLFSCTLHIARNIINKPLDGYILNVMLYVTGPGKTNFIYT